MSDRRVGRTQPRAIAGTAGPVYVDHAVDELCPHGIIDRLDTAVMGRRP